MPTLSRLQAVDKWKSELLFKLKSVPRFSVPGSRWSNYHLSFDQLLHRLFCEAKYVLVFQSPAQTVQTFWEIVVPFWVHIVLIESTMLLLLALCKCYSSSCRTRVVLSLLSRNCCLHPNKYCDEQVWLGLCPVPTVVKFPFPVGWPDLVEHVICIYSFSYLWGMNVVSSAKPRSFRRPCTNNTLSTWRLCHLCVHEMIGSLRSWQRDCNQIRNSNVAE